MNIPGMAPFRDTRTISATQAFSLDLSNLRGQLTKHQLRHNHLQQQLINYLSCGSIDELKVYVTAVLRNGSRATSAPQTIQLHAMQELWDLLALEELSKPNDAKDTTNPPRPIT
jgi:hypothetical protein